MNRVKQGIAVLAVLLALMLAACGGSASKSPASSPGTPTRASSAPTVKTATKTVGGKAQAVLVDAKGMTLYYFTADRGGMVTCTGTCAQNWPPLRLEAGVSIPVAGTGVTGKLASVSNPEGGTQVTYNGWPLYYYFKDKDAGDTYGQGVGGKWFVVTPDLAPAM